jgi:hypothetical protein
MKNIILFLSLYASIAVFSQDNTRNVIAGKITSDSLDVENVTVLNVTTNIGAITDIEGKFYLKAKEKDTLVIRGLAYHSKIYILSKSDEEKKQIELFLKVKINELNEVEVTPFTLSGNLEEDTKKIKVIENDFSSIDFSKMKPKDIREVPVVNNANPQIFSTLTGINFILIFDFIGNKVGSLLGVKKAERISNSEQVFYNRKLKEVKSKPFTEHMKEKFSNHFFVSSLKIKNEDIPFFLAFSECTSEELLEFLKPENELYLIEYLIIKSKEFKDAQKE